MFYLWFLTLYYILMTDSRLILWELFQLLVLLTREEGFQGYNDTLNRLHCIELELNTREI